MELAFLTLLLKDGADSISGGVAIDDEGVIKTGLMKDWSHTNSVDEHLEGGFVFLFPVEFAAFRAKRNKSVKGGCYAQALGVVDVGSLSVELSWRITVRSGRPSCRALQGQSHGVRHGYRGSGEVGQSA